MKTLDLRKVELKPDLMKQSDVNVIASIVVAAFIFTAIVGYNLWLDSGCVIQGVMTWHGKVCLQD